MTRKPSPFRVMALCLALVPAGSAPAFAGDIFPCLHPEKKSCFDKYTDSTRIVTPSRQVEVVNAAPQVVVRDAPSREVVSRTLRHTVAAAPLPIGTVYMPLAMPAVGAFPMFGVPQPGVRETTETIPNHLEALHRAEVAQFHATLQAERARAEVNATLEAQKRVAARLGAGPVTQASGTCDQSGVEKKLAELASQMKDLNDRVTSIERLLLIHDNIIRDKVLSSTTPTMPPPVIPTPTKDPPKVPMIPPLP